MWPFRGASRNGTIRAGFACGNEFLGVVDEVAEVHLFAAMVCNSRTPDPAVGSRQDGHWGTVSLWPLIGRLILSFPFRIIPGCILPGWTSARNRRDFAARAVASMCRYGGLLPRTISGLGSLTFIRAAQASWAKQGPNTTASITTPLRPASWTHQKNAVLYHRLYCTWAMPAVAIIVIG